MTDHRPDDPMRALDAVDAPDQWQDITTRAALPGSEVADLTAARAARARTRARALLAAAVLVVAAVAVGLVAANQGDPDRTDVASTPTGSTAAAPPDDPAEMAGREWLLRSLTVDGRAVAEPLDFSATLAFDGQTLDVRVCNRLSAPARIEDGHLVSKSLGSTLAGCAGPTGERKMAVETVLGRFLATDPAIELRGDRLTLTSGGTVATFASPGYLGQPDYQEYLVDGDSTCAVAFEPGDLRATITTPLAAGPADPPLVDPSAFPHRGTWHLAIGGQTVEIHAPGLRVTDFVGETTEEVALADGRPATLWITDEWVQLRDRLNSASEDDCGFNDITVAGPDVTANKNLALTVSKHLRIVPTPTTETATTTTLPVTTTSIGDAGPTTTTEASAEVGPSTTTSIVDARPSTTTSVP